ncbi:unnamed protein product [Orchesella dallaii]|uniref:Uncharacterized protein n=1 Tax=Orchesella dallaii TaxID=48710 RepID=A0ABP1RMY0_9HEXA
MAENESASASSNSNSPSEVDSPQPSSSRSVRPSTLIYSPLMPRNNEIFNSDEDPFLTEDEDEDQEDDETIKQLKRTYCSIETMMKSLPQIVNKKMKQLADFQRESKQKISNFKHQLASAKQQEAECQGEWKEFASAFVTHVDSGSIAQNLCNMKKNLELACSTGICGNDYVDEMAAAQDAIVEIIDPAQHNEQYIELHCLYESTKERGLILKEKRAAIQEQIQSLNQQVEEHKLELFKTRVNLLQLANQIVNYDQPINSAVAGPSQGKRKRLEEPIPEDNEEIQDLQGENSELEQLENQGQCEGQSRSIEHIAPEVPEDEAGVDDDEVMDEGNPPLQNQENSDEEPEQVAFPPPMANAEINPAASNQLEDAEPAARPPPLNIVEEEAQVPPVAVARSVGKNAPKKRCHLCGEIVYNRSFRLHVRKYCSKAKYQRMLRGRLIGGK